VLVLTLTPFAALAQIPKNNLQVVTQLFDRVAYRVAESIAREGVIAIWLQAPANPKPEERFFFSRLVTVFNDSLRLPIFTAPVDSLPTTALAYRVQRCEIAYQPLPRRRFWQKSRWQRHANIIVELGAHDVATRQLRLQKIFVESAADTLAGKILPRLEDQGFDFTLGSRESRDENPRWLEPVLITAATGVVIYLFYSLRSR
jgi:hypothetical protein